MQLRLGFALISVVIPAMPLEYYVSKVMAGGDHEKALVSRIIR
jgi:hypothetical protein